MTQRLLDDLAVDTELWGGLDELSTRLAESLPRFPPSSPVLVSGPWGSGKTSLLESIKKKLSNPEQNRSSMAVCLFEAWRYEGELPIFAALVRQILQETEKAPAAQERARKERFSRCRERLWKTTVAFCGGIGPGVAGMLAGPAGAASAALIKGLLSAEKTSTSYSDVSHQALNDLLIDRSDTLWRAFQDLLKVAYPVTEPGTPALLVLIDDLDRCSPEGTIRLLEGIRHFVARSNHLPVRFVTALDRGILSQAISRKFDGLDAFEGNRYLEKIFPLVFNLPRPTLVEIDSMVGGFSRKLGLESDDQEVARSVFTNEMFANPRLIKRVLNRFALWLEFEQSRSTSLTEDPDRREQEIRRRVILVAWLAACERWPGLRGLLARRKSHYWQELWSYARADVEPGAPKQGAADRNGPSRAPDPDAERILQEQDLRSWLKSRDEGGASYERAERRLQRWGL